MAKEVKKTTVKKTTAKAKKPKAEDADVKKGKPIFWTPEKKRNAINIILHEISENGKSTRSILTNADRNILPSNVTFCEWLAQDEVLADHLKDVKENETYINNTKCKANPKGTIALDLNDYRLINARNTNKSKYPESSLYIIKIKDQNLYKIGVSNNTHRRFRDLNSSLPFNFDIIFNKKINNAYDVEEYIHNKLHLFHVKNEWFSLTKNDVKEVLELLCN